MRQSKLFTKTIKEIPSEEKSKNAQLLIRAGFVDKLMAGVYSYLPLGLKVFKKIENIIREEIEKIGGQELFLPSLQPKSLWEKTDRWRYDEMFKIKNRQDKDFGLGWTHEEIVTPLVQKFVKSYKDLPVYVYQIQNKFRDELRAKSGLLRGVEFSMKDLYSFHKDQLDLDEYYEKAKAAYSNIFKRCGLAEKTFLTLASGGAFSEYSHEFQTITPAGEDEIYLCKKCNIAINKEIIEKEKRRCPVCKSDDLETHKSIEVGNIFKLQNRFSSAFDFKFRDKDGKEKEVLMGCYGIGLGRLMGTIAEINSDDKGIMWPKEVAPHQIHLIQIDVAGRVKEVSENLYKDFQNAGKEVLYDDREDRTAGEKFADADLIGIPLRIVVSQRTIDSDCVEVKNRGEKEVKLINIAHVSEI